MWNGPGEKVLEEDVAEPKFKSKFRGEFGSNDIGNRSAAIDDDSVSDGELLSSRAGGRGGKREFSKVRLGSRKDRNRRSAYNSRE